MKIKNKLSISFIRLAHLFNKNIDYANFKMSKNVVFSLTNNVPYKIEGKFINNNELEKYFWLSKKKLKQKYTIKDIQASKNKKKILFIKDYENCFFLNTFPNYFLFITCLFNIIYFSRGTKKKILISDKLYRIYKKDINKILANVKNIKITTVNTKNKNFIFFKKINLIYKKQMVNFKLPWQFILIASKSINNYLKLLKLKRNMNTKIFLVRDKAERRNLENSNEIKKFLKKEGFRIINPLKKNIIELMQICFDSRKIVMQSGSAMTNLYFSQAKKVKLLNLFNATGSSDQWVEYLSEVKNINYKILRGKNTKTKKSHNLLDNSNFIIDLNAFKKEYYQFF